MSSSSCREPDEEGCYLISSSDYLLYHQLLGTHNNHKTVETGLSNDPVQNLAVEPQHGEEKPTDKTSELALCQPSSDDVAQDDETQKGAQKTTETQEDTPSQERSEEGSALKEQPQGLNNTGQSSGEESPRDEPQTTSAAAPSLRDYFKIAQSRISKKYHPQFRQFEQKVFKNKHLQKQLSKIKPESLVTLLQKYFSMRRKKTCSEEAQFRKLFQKHQLKYLFISQDADLQNKRWWTLPY